jgi:hypothetical protein
VVSGTTVERAKSMSSLPRMLQTTFSWNRWTSAREVRNSPVRRMSVCSTDAVAMPRSNSPGQFSISA